MLLYASLHAVLALAVFGVAFVLARRRLGVALALAGIGLLGALSLEGWRPWERASAHWANPVHTAKLHLLLLGTVGLVATLKHRTGRGAWIAAPLVGGLLALAGLSTLAPPPPLAFPPGVVDANGIVRQTTRMSCAPAAAATLLRRLELDTDASEAELAQLCRTDPQTGTLDGDLVRGVTQAVPSRRVRILRSDLNGLRGRTQPCVLFVGLDPGRAGDPKLYRVLRDECGWTEGEAHTVVYFGVEPGRAGEDVEVALVGDPRTGFERWGITHFKALWDGRLLEVSAPK